MNGSNKEKDLAHVQRYAERFAVTVDDRTDDIALLAVQGPGAEAILQQLQRGETD